MSILILDLATTTTLLHEEIAKVNSDDSKIYILYFNEKKYKNSPINNKFFINLSCNKEPEHSSLELAIEIENRTGINYNRCLYLDRYIKDKDLLSRYYLNYIFEIEKIIKKERIELIVGELSLGWEIMTYGLCKLLNINYVLPLNVYAFDKPRLSFFNINHDDYYMSLIQKNKNHTISSEFITEQIRKRKETDINKGFGDKLAKTFNKNLFVRFKYNFSNKSDTDYRENLIRKFLNKASNTLHNRINKIFIKKHGVKDLSCNYYLYLLHIQPEVTPDTTATYFSNQYEVIRQLALRLPFNHKLYVKEHPNGLGCRTKTDLQKIIELPNVELLDLNISSAEAIKSAQGVITIAGTGSFEGILNNVKSAIFNDVYFGKLPGMYRINQYSDITDFYNLPRTTTTEVKDLTAYYKKVFEGSFDCFWHQPFLMDGVISEKNVKNIRESLIYLLNILRK